MRMMLTVTFPNKPFNELVRKGKAGQKIQKILDELKPSAAYFTDRCGNRSVVLIVEVSDMKQIPAMSEPWFLQFNAELHWGIAMTPKDLAKADLEKLGKKWG